MKRSKTSLRVRKLNIDANALIDVLKSEKESYQGLLNLSKKEQELIVSGNIEDLSDVVKATEQMMRVVRDLERKRLTLLDVDTNSNLSQPTPQLSTILKDFDKQTAEAAAELKDQMLAIVEDLGETNKTNAELLRRNIGHTNFLFNAIMRDESPVYGQKPNPQGVNPKLFDGRA